MTSTSFVQVHLFFGKQFLGDQKETCRQSLRYSFARVAPLSDSNRYGSKMHDIDTIGSLVVQMISYWLCQHKMSCSITTKLVSVVAFQPSVIGRP